MEIPQHIKDQIDEMAIKESSSPSDYGYLVKYYRLGYSLAKKEIEELREENRRLKDGLKRITRLGADESSRMRSIAEQIINS